jgi:hypothetical protein
MSTTQNSPLADDRPLPGPTTPAKTAGILGTSWVKLHQVSVVRTARKVATHEKPHSRISASCHSPNNSNKASVSPNS